MRTTARTTLAVALVAATACRPPGELPENMDGLLSAYWLEAQTATDDRLAELASSIPGIVDVEGLAEGAQDASQGRLTREHLEMITFEAPPEGGDVHDPDPAEAVPWLVMSRFPCERDVLESLLTWPDQNEIYGTYDDYERTFTSSRDDFLAGTAQTLSWDGTLVATIPLLVGQYSYDFRNDLRRSPLGQGGDAQYVVRTWLPYPGRFERQGRSFTQDYQLEVFLPVEGGDIVHVYGTWRQMDYGDVGTTEAIEVQRISINQTIKWDERTAEVCALGGPENLSD